MLKRFSAAKNVQSKSVPEMAVFRIFTQNTSNDVLPGKEVPFGGPDDDILYLDP